jgi:hypothetical protein
MKCKIYTKKISTLKSFRLFQSHKIMKIFSLRILKLFKNSQKSFFLFGIGKNNEYSHGSKMKVHLIQPKNLKNRLWHTTYSRY